MALETSSLGCGAGRPRPGVVDQPQAAFVPVPHPPPPGRVEFVPDSPREGAVWVAGEWTYRFRRWSWVHGGWVLPPAGAAGHAPWTLKRDARGELWFAPGAWRDPRGGVVDAPEVLATGRARDRAVIEEDGTPQQVGPNAAAPPPLPAD